MLLINLHAVPTKQTDYFDEFIGAYISVYINFKDVDGAMQLAKFYVEKEGWVVNNIEEDYYEIEDVTDLDEEQQELFEEAQEYGYTMVFNAYETSTEEE